MLLNNIKLHISIFLVADIIIAVVDVVDLESNTGDVFFSFLFKFGQRLPDKSEPRITDKNITFNQI